MPFPEVQCLLVEVEHEPTGAQIIYIANDDDENVFNLSFRTWPEKSNGVAHILEHIALCGSKNFPIRDPFFGMTRRSLNTFMNAITGPDFTCYPASTQITKDFYNLLIVYLDAVFKPLLTKLSFLQEGHRLELSNPDDPQAPLVFKGIVFNEMKGAMATGNARLGEALMQGLFPDITYGINSGGDPTEIPQLTYEELRTFHETFYHPSRCLFYFYGNIPLKQHLDFLEEHAFQGVEKISPLPLLPKQPRFTKKVEKTLYYPLDEGEGETKTLFGLGWLTCSILEQEEILALTVIDLVLMGTDAAPLKLALLRSNLCKQADSILDSEMSEVPFTIVCKGCAPDSGDAIEELIRSVLKTIVQEGLPRHLIDGSIHQIELSRSEITGNSSPYGLSLFFRSALLKQHGGDPGDGIKIHTLFSQLRKKVEDPSYLPSLIEKYLLNNPHCVRIILNPDKTLAEKENNEEREKLEKIRSSLDEADLVNIIADTKELLAYQEEAEEEDFDVLPKVTLDDVPKQEKEFLLKKETIGNFTVFHHPCFTNEIVYVDLLIDLPEIAEEDLPYLRLFSLFLPEIGAGGRTYQEHLEYLLQHTGGLGVSLDLCLQSDNPTEMHPFLNIQGKALTRKLDKFFPVLRDTIVDADFTDIARLKELLMQHVHSVENSIQHSPLRYAVNLAARGLSIPSKILNNWYGLDYYWALKKIVVECEQQPTLFIEKLQSMQQLCLGVEKKELILGCDEETYQAMKKEIFFGILDLPSKPFKKWTGKYQPSPSSTQGRTISSPVAFTTLLFPSLCYTDPDAATLSIAAQIMDNTTLHKRIREQGGAYGTGAVNGILSGQFYFYSYRDPQLPQTLDAFIEAIDKLEKGEFDDNDLQEAKLGLFQDLDSPIAPGSRAMTAYSRLRAGRTAERRQFFRDRLFAIGKEEVRCAAANYLRAGLEKSVLVTFAGKELFEKEHDFLEKQSIPIYFLEERG